MVSRRPGEGLGSEPGWTLTLWGAATDSPPQLRAQSGVTHLVSACGAQGAMATGQPLAPQPGLRLCPHGPAIP